MSHFDIAVIGAGSGGVRLARMCAGKGKRSPLLSPLSLGVPALTLDVFRRSCLSMLHISGKISVMHKALAGKWIRFSSTG